MSAKEGDVNSWEKTGQERIRDLEMTLVSLLEARVFAKRYPRDRERKEREYTAWAMATKCFPMTDEERKEIVGEF